MPLMVWQAIRLEIASRWSPVKLEGDFAQGYFLLADLHRPRLGVRWFTPSQRKLDPTAIVRKTMLQEVGQLAADQATPLTLSRFREGLLYIEPEPPGRDIWIGLSESSGRIVQVIHHAHRREKLLRQSVLPTLVDLSDDNPRPWAVFDLSCRTPRDLNLESQLLNAGDLTLSFANKTRRVKVRQIAVAELALKKRPLDQWLAAEMRGQRKYFRPVDEATEILVACHGRPLKGFAGIMQRRRRFGLAWKIPPRWAIIALHDEKRDRLLVVQGGEEQLVRDIAESIGWATTV